MKQLWLVLFVVGCQAVSAVAPSAIADVACVIADAAKKDSISQIVLDCGGDTAQVIAILADPANYTQVQSTPAFSELGRVKSTLQK